MFPEPKGSATPACQVPDPGVEAFEVDSRPMANRADIKRLLVLANSVKKNGRCVAGRLLTDGSPAAALGWCRPISDTGEGELYPRHMVLSGKTELCPLDVVDVPVSGYAKNPAHPEDWMVSGDQWTRVKRLKPQVLPRLVEEPRGLWLEDRNRPDRVSPAFFTKEGKHQSLYLIRPGRLRLRLWREVNEFKGYTQKKTRVLFDYGGQPYDLSLTDPVATSRHCQTFPTLEQPASEFPFPFGDKCVLCVSLTPPFEKTGFHYKVVATVLELP
jgi:hypothetical protein